MSVLRMQKNLEFHLLFYNFFLDIQSEKTKKGRILGALDYYFFLEICVKIRIFVQKTWKSRTKFYQKSLENPTSSI